MAVVAKEDPGLWAHWKGQALVASTADGLAASLP